jgi:uncharacterized delta-60 repeat protein
VLDPSFGTGGKLTTSIGTKSDEANCTALQADGKIVVAGTTWDQRRGELAVARYQPDGTLDTTFNGTGKVTTAVGNDGDKINGIAIQPDGKIVVGGTSGFREFELARFNADGSPDKSFSGSGKKLFPIGKGNAIAGDVLLLPNDRIVVVGGALGEKNADFALVCGRSDGTLDTSFNSSGMVLTDFGDTEYAYCATVQSDGKMVLAGFSGLATNADLAVARYLPDGSVDETFGEGGKSIHDVGGSADYCRCVIVQPDGKILVVGNSGFGDESQFLLARFCKDGSSDVGFGNKGFVTTAIGDSSSIATSEILLADGKILVAGQASQNHKKSFVLVRYNADGSLDPSFNGSGMVFTAVTEKGSDGCNDMIAQRDGRVLMIGSSTNWIGNIMHGVFVLARFTGCGQAADSDQKAK